MKTEAEIKEAIRDVMLLAAHDKRETMGMMLLSTVSALRWVIGEDAAKGFQGVLDDAKDIRQVQRSAAVN